MADMTYEDAKDQAIYEIAFHIDPNLSDTEVAAAAERVKKLVAGAGGAVVAEGAPKRIQLAYDITRMEQGRRYDYAYAFFAWFAYEGAPEAAAAIEAEVKADKAIIRHLVVKTTKEQALHSEEMHKARRQEEEAESTLEEEAPAASEEAAPAPEEARATL